MSNVAYANLRVEMARKNIGLVELAGLSGINRDTLSRKLSMRTRLNLDDAFKIQRAAFPECDLDYLFAEDTPTE